MSTPMWLTDAFVNKSGTAFGLGILIALALVGASIGLGYFKINKIHERDFLIWNNESVEKYDLWKLARIYI